MLNRPLIFSLCLFAVVCCSAVSAAEFPKFTEKVIDANCGKVCYAVTAADVNGDGRIDIVAVTENRVLWYENPSWKPHTIIEDQTVRDNVCIAAADIDGDGKVDFALGAGWTKTGTIQWLSRGKSLAEKWHVHKIGEEKWLHRMRFADVLGKGKPQLVISPLNKTVGNGVRLTAFEIPEHPKADRWRPVVLDATLNRMHNHWHADFDRAAPIDTLTASSEGVHLIRRNGDRWTKTRLANGAPGKTPNSSGAGEIKIGKLKSGGRFIATVEPMHGTMLVVYTQPKPGSRLWQRHVITDKLIRGHALWTADFDGDGADEIVIGHSNTKEGPNLSRGLYVYSATSPLGTKWARHVIDEGSIAVEDAIAADFTGDGKIDIVAGGRYTHNIKLYINNAK